MKTKKNKSINFFKLGILFFGISILLWSCEKDDNINLNNSQNEFSIPSIIQTKKLFQQKIFSKKHHSKSEKNLKILWEQSIPKEFKENINILYTPINYNSSKRFKSLIASVKKENQIQSYILTLVYDKTSNNQQFSGHIFKHDSKGDFIEVYQYQNGNYIQTLKELNTSNKYANRGCSCSTSVFDVVELIIAGWDVGSLLDCVCVGGTSGGGDSTTYDDWSTPSSNIKNPDDWTLGSNDNLGGGSGGTFGDPNNGGDSNNSNGEELNLDGVEPWWEEDDQIIDEIEDPKIKCLNEKLTKNGNTFVKDLLANFNGNSEFDIKIKSVQNIFSRNRQQYVSGQSTHTPGEKLIYINISTDKLSSVPALAGIRTILHEYIHADIYRKLNTKDDANEDKIKDFKETYNKYKAEGHHNSMANLYINLMTNSLKDIHKKILSREVDYLTNNGTNSIDDLYEALAWQGLKNHKLDDWKNLGNDTTRINDALNKHFHSLTKNCPN